MNREQCWEEFKKVLNIKEEDFMTEENYIFDNFFEVLEDESLLEAFAVNKLYKENIELFKKIISEIKKGSLDKDSAIELLDILEYAVENKEQHKKEREEKISKYQSDISELVSEYTLAEINRNLLFSEETPTIEDAIEMIKAVVNDTVPAVATITGVFGVVHSVISETALLPTIFQSVGYGMYGIAAGTAIALGIGTSIGIYKEVKNLYKEMKNYKLIDTNAEFMEKVYELAEKYGIEDYKIYDTITRRKKNILGVN